MEIKNKTKTWPFTTEEFKKGVTWGIWTKGEVEAGETFRSGWFQWRKLKVAEGILAAVTYTKY